MGRYDQFTLTNGTHGCIDKTNGNFYTPCPPLPGINDKPDVIIPLGMIGSGVGGTLGPEIIERTQNSTKFGKSGISPSDIVSRLTKYRGFLGSNKATLKSSGIYLGASALGAIVGCYVTKTKEKKYQGVLVGLGVGLASGAIINALTK